MCPFEIVFSQIQYHDLAARLQKLFDGGDGFRRILGMMQGLTEDCQIDAGGVYWWVLQVALAKFEILQPVLLCFGCAERDNFLGVIHRDYPFASPREQFTQQS